MQDDHESPLKCLPIGSLCSFTQRTPFFQSAFPTVLRGETTKPRDAKSLPTPGFWLQEAGRLHHYPDPIWLG